MVKLYQPYYYFVIFQPTDNENTAINMLGSEKLHYIGKGASYMKMLIPIRAREFSQP